MAFGREYFAPDYDAHFGAVSKEQLAETFRCDQGETRFLGPGFRDRLGDPDQLYRYLNSNVTQSWAITIHNTVAGLAIIQTTSEIPFVRTVIASEYQGRGLSKPAHAVRMNEWFANTGHDTLMGHAHPHNFVSRRNMLSRGYYPFLAAAESGEAYDQFLAVNPKIWETYHSENPHQHATSEARQRIEETMNLITTLQVVE